MTETKVEIKNTSGETLVGVETMPAGKLDKNPAVILAHGFAYYKEEDGIFVELAKRLAELGIVCYRFDFSGCGESEGDYADTTLTKLTNDLKTIYEYVTSKEYIDAEKIGIVGQSFGTTVTIALAPKIKSLVLMGSFLDGKKILSDLFAENYKPDGVSAEKRSDGSITKINPPFWKDFENHDTVAQLKKIKCPLLLIHGSLDVDVPLSAMEQIYKEANEPKQKAIIEGADHGLQPKREEVYGIVVKWFTKTLLS